jgi:hypothetical protein
MPVHTPLGARAKSTNMRGEAWEDDSSVETLSPEKYPERIRWTATFDHWSAEVEPPGPEFFELSLNTPTPSPIRKYEQRSQVRCVAECPKCRKEVECVAETEEWSESERDSNIWLHEHYGPSQGICCDVLIADWYEGTFCYDLSRSDG